MDWCIVEIGFGGCAWVLWDMRYGLWVLRLREGFGRGRVDGGLEGEIGFGVAMEMEADGIKDYCYYYFCRLDCL